MSEAQAFRDLIQRVRGGDEDAATEIVQRYEATIRMAIRVRLDQSDLRRLLDSMDICQSVRRDYRRREGSPEERRVAGADPSPSRWRPIGSFSRTSAVA